MRCQTCGAPLDRPGQGHNCLGGPVAVDEPAETFSLATRRVLRFGVVYVVMVAIAEAVSLAGYTAISAGAADPTAVSTQASVLVGAAVVGFVVLACILALVVSTGVWLISAHRLGARGPAAAGAGAAGSATAGAGAAGPAGEAAAEGRSTRGAGPVAYGAVFIWLLLAVLAYVVPRHVPSLAGTVATEAALRVGGVLVLIAGVTAVRNRLRRETGNPALGARRSLVTGDDWDASKWDPDVQKDIEHRRGS